MSARFLRMAFGQVLGGYRQADWCGARRAGITAPRLWGRIVGLLGLAVLELGCTGRLGEAGGWFAPQGERWTIECVEFQGPGSQGHAKQVAEVLKRSPGVDAKSVWVQGQPDRACIYYGTYYRKVNPATRVRQPSRAMAADLTMLRNLVDDEGRRFFMGARRVPAPSTAAEHAEWNLRNVEASYTLQVGVYYNDSKLHDRRLAAVEKCRRLRSKGYEAYYYHADTCSMVTIGAFGPGAVLDPRGQVRFIGRGGNRQQLAHHYSQAVVDLQNQADCKYNRTNDNVEYNIDRGGKRVPVWSMLVHVPKDERAW